MSFEFSTTLKHISLNLHIIIGLLELKVSKISKAIYPLFPETSRYSILKKHKSKKVSCGLIFLGLGQKLALIFTNVFF